MTFQTRLGGLHSALCILHSVDFAPIAAWQQEGKWHEASRVLCLAARQLESVGSEGLVFDVCVPDTEARAFIHDIIFQGLCKGKIVDALRERCLTIIRSLYPQGIEGVILGCTELGLLFQPQHIDLPLFDSASLHVHHAADWMLKS